MANTIDYVVGFPFAEGSQEVIFIEKKRPDFQKGRLNGCGGKIEEGETPLDAMRRACREETGYEIEEWRHFATLAGTAGGDPQGQPWRVYFFRGRYNERTPRARVEHDEPVVKVSPKFLPDNVLTNARWLIQMALSIHADSADHFVIWEQYTKDSSVESVTEE